MSKTSNYAVRLENVTKTFYLNNQEIHVLKDVSFSIEKGSSNSIIGASGSGKTTLLNIIGALNIPTSGEVWIDNEKISEMSPKQLAWIRSRKLGYCFQSYNLIPVLNAYDNIELPLLITKTPEEERKERVHELLELVGLSHRDEHKPHELSGGEQQRVTIARALANSPEVLLADEPTGDLDEKTGEKIISLLFDINKSISQTLIMVTHDKAIADLTDNIFEMKDGRLVDLP
jgi:putative ABC transport system ATP-binding protein